MRSLIGLSALAFTGLMRRLLPVDTLSSTYFITHIYYMTPLISFLDKWQLYLDDNVLVQLLFVVFAHQIVPISSRPQISLNTNIAYLLVIYTSPKSLYETKDEPFSRPFVIIYTTCYGSQHTKWLEHYRSGKSRNGRRIYTYRQFGYTKSTISSRLSGRLLS